MSYIAILTIAFIYVASAVCLYTVLEENARSETVGETERFASRAVACIPVINTVLLALCLANMLAYKLSYGTRDNKPTAE